MIEYEQVALATKIGAEAVAVKDVLGRGGAAITAFPPRNLPNTDRMGFFNTSHKGVFIPALGRDASFNARTLAKAIIGANYTDESVSSGIQIEYPKVNKLSNSVDSKVILRMSLERGADLLRFCFQSLGIPVELVKDALDEYERYSDFFSDEVETKYKAIDGLKERCLPSAVPSFNS